MDDDQPIAEAVLIEGERILAVGSERDLVARAPDAALIDLGGRVLMPGLVEPHGHPSGSAVFVSEFVVDIRPVVLETADQVMDALRSAISERPEGVLANGWDPLLQRGLNEPTMAELDALAGDVPLVIVHNSGHAVYFNAAAARVAGVTRETPDPDGAAFRRDENGDLTGVGVEAGVLLLLAGPTMAKAQSEFPKLFADELVRANRAGVTTVADLGWNPAQNALLDVLRDSGALTARLRLYEMSTATGGAIGRADAGDDLVRQIGIKTWADGSPWTGNIATSFPYLSNDVTASIGLEPGHVGAANFTEEEILSISQRYAAEGWQLSCHAHGDLAIDSVLNAWERVILDSGLTDHRFRLEHVGAMTPEQFERAAALGVTVSVFADHVYYWGDVLVDDLFGEPGERWADAAAAFATGIRATFHNDGTVTPLEPFRNMAVAETRRSRSGRVLDGAAGVLRSDALRAHTINAAWQLRSDDVLGSITVGKYADLVIVDRDPSTVSAEELAETRVLGVYLAGVPVL
nr:amidohydrolase [Lysinibacter cavernae]